MDATALAGCARTTCWDSPPKRAPGWLPPSFASAWSTPTGGTKMMPGGAGVGVGHSSESPMLSSASCRWLHGWFEPGQIGSQPRDSHHRPRASRDAVHAPLARARPCARTTHRCRCRRCPGRTLRGLTPCLLRTGFAPAELQTLPQQPPPAEGPPALPRASAWPPLLPCQLCCAARRPWCSRRPCGPSHS